MRPYSLLGVVFVDDQLGETDSRCGLETFGNKGVLRGNGEVASSHHSLDMVELGAILASAAGDGGVIPPS